MEKLRHPNIVTFYGLSIDSCERYSMVIEYMPDGSLYGLLHNLKPLEWSVRYRIAHDVTSGLSLLHSKNILHRDLKSLNVLLYKQVHKQEFQIRAKLTDFGLSRIRSETSVSSQASSRTNLVGTARWMGPEQIIMNKGEKAEYTRKTDIYSYGMILWELASRQIPFPDMDHDIQVMFAVKTGNRPVIPEDCPPSFAKLIKWCWHQDPAQRPTVDKAVKALMPPQHAQGSTSTSTETAPSYRENLSSESPDYRFFSENDPSTHLGNGRF